MQLVIEVPETLGQQLQKVQTRLPEILTLGFHELFTDKATEFQEEGTILTLLASQPPPEQVLAIRPSGQLQNRMSYLLAESKQGQLSRQEESELERYLWLEHLVRLAKGYAYQQLGFQERQQLINVNKYP